MTLTDDDCTYEGDASPSAAETFELEVANESSKFGAFEIGRIEAGGSFADVEAYVESERARLADGLEIAGPPSFMTNLARSEVAAGQTGTLVATVAAGDHVLWCAHGHPPTALFLITPALQVSE